jgi:hypothetical protein
MVLGLMRRLKNKTEPVAQIGVYLNKKRMDCQRVIKKPHRVMRLGKYAGA